MGWEKIHEVGLEFRALTTRLSTPPFIALYRSLWNIRCSKFQMVKHLSWNYSVLFWSLYVTLLQRESNPHWPGPQCRGGQRGRPASGRFSANLSSACFRPVTLQIPDPMLSWKSSWWKWRASVLGSFVFGFRTRDAKIRREVWRWDTHRSSLRGIWLVAFTSL